MAAATNPQKPLNINPVCCFLTLAAVGSVVPESRSALPAARPADPLPAGAATALRVAGLDERRRGVAVALPAPGAGVEAKGAVLRGVNIM